MSVVGVDVSPEAKAAPYAAAHGIAPTIDAEFEPAVGSSREYVVLLVRSPKTPMLSGLPL
jgi:hypothetical protein